MRLQTFVIGMLILGGVSAGLGVLISGMNASTTDINVTANLSTYEVLEDMSGVVNSSDSKLQTNQIDSQTGDIALQLSVFDVLTVVKNAFSFVPAILTDAARYFNVPTWVIVLAGSIISTLLIFAVVNAIFGRNT